MSPGQKKNLNDTSGLDSSDASLSDQDTVYFDPLSLSIERYQTELEDDGESFSKETSDYEEADSFSNQTLGKIFWYSFFE